MQYIQMKKNWYENVHCVPNTCTYVHVYICMYTYVYATYICSMRRYTCNRDRISHKNFTSHSVFVLWVICTSNIALPVMSFWHYKHEVEFSMHKKEGCSF